MNSIVKELHDEKIDIVKYSDVVEEYIASALAPSSRQRDHISTKGRAAASSSLTTNFRWPSARKVRMCA